MRWAHDASRILSVLNEKANRYGALEVPLVIAVLSNPEFHTEDLDVERALFGALIGRRPSPNRRDPASSSTPAAGAPARDGDECTSRKSLPSRTSTHGR